LNDLVDLAKDLDEEEERAVNDLVPADNLAYLLKYDTTHGKLAFDVKAVGEDVIEVSKEGKIISTIKTLAMKARPAELPLKDLNIDIVIESTGFFTKKEDASGHLTAGAKK